MNTIAEEKYTVTLESVSKSYQEKSHEQIKALSNICLNLSSGEVLGLFGHNGAGKSTMMKLILGLIRPTQGHVSAFGCDPSQEGSQSYRQQFGFLPENVSFYDHLSGYEVLLYLAKLKGYDKREVEKKLELVDLARFSKRAIKTYSKGMRQRLGLAQALLGMPKLLLLDEPTVGLDPLATEDFYKVVDELKAQGCAVVLCSHILPGVEQHIDRIMMLQYGQQLCLGQLTQLSEDAMLPVNIDLQGLSKEECSNQIQQVIPLERWSECGILLTEKSEKNIHIDVPEQYKLVLLNKFLSLDSLKDVAIKQPSLSDLYRYFQSKSATKESCHQHQTEKVSSLVGREKVYG